MKNNIIQKKKSTTEQIESTLITKETIKKYICSDATEQELVFFLELCKSQNLNPFLKEAYLVKYNNRSASLIVAKDVFLKRANTQPQYRGYKAGVIVDRIGKVEYQEGSFVLKNDTILGGWAEVYTENREPLRIEVAFDEYAGRKKDGTLSGQWAGKPATMIRKVALVQALREAFPETFQGMYDESELAAMNANKKARAVKIETPREQIAAESKIVDEKDGNLNDEWAEKPVAMIQKKEAQERKERTELLSKILEIAQTKFGIDGLKDGIRKTCNITTFKGVDARKLKDCLARIERYEAVQPDLIKKNNIDYSEGGKEVVK